jgi:hypothetical protein
MVDNDIGDLWPTGIFDSAIRAPYTLLKEQALLLGEKSSRLILGRVQRVIDQYSDAPVRLSLRARVPDMGDYEVELVSLEHHPQRLYPVTVRDREHGEEAQLDTEADLITWLRGELRSAWVRNTMQTLIAQVKDPEARPPKPPKTDGDVDYGDIPF